MEEEKKEGKYQERGKEWSRGKEGKNEIGGGGGKRKERDGRK